jgi:GTP-binding protein
VIFTSATAGFQLERWLEAIRYVAAQWHQKVPTAVLNRILIRAVEERQPVTADGALLKLYYATQTGVAPPRFRLFANRPGPLGDAYAKYLKNRLRQAFGFEGCPILLNLTLRPKTIASIRSRGARRA